jgi:hypothetical protein
VAKDPPFAGVGEELPAAVGFHDGAALTADVGEVGVDDEVAVALVEHEPVRAPGVLARGVAPRAAVAVVGRRHGVPPHHGAAELVGDLLAVVHAEHEAAAAPAVARALGPQRPRLPRAPGAEVRRGALVRGPAPHPLAAAILGEGDREVGVQEPREEAARVAAQEGPAGEAVRQQVAREVRAHHAPREHRARERRPEAREPLHYPRDRRRGVPRHGSWPRRHVDVHLNPFQPIDLL